MLLGPSTAITASMIGGRTSGAPRAGGERKAMPTHNAPGPGKKPKGPGGNGNGSGRSGGGKGRGHGRGGSGFTAGVLLFGHWAYDQPSGTDGGSTSGGVYNIVPLDAELTNEITGASLASSQITLPAGTFYIEAWSDGHTVGRNKVLLRNVTDSTYDLIGMCRGAYDHSELKGRIVITAEKVFELHFFTETTEADVGFGGACTNGVKETYGEVLVWQEA